MTWQKVDPVHSFNNAKVSLQFEKWNLCHLILLFKVHTILGFHQDLFEFFKLQVDCIKLKVGRLMHVYQAFGTSKRWLLDACLSSIRDKQKVVAWCMFIKHSGQAKGGCWSLQVSGCFIVYNELGLIPYQSSLSLPYTKWFFIFSCYTFILFPRITTRLIIQFLIQGCHLWKYLLKIWENGTTDFSMTSLCTLHKIKKVEQIRIQNVLNVFPRNVILFSS